LISQTSCNNIGYNSQGAIPFIYYSYDHLARLIFSNEKVWEEEEEMEEEMENDLEKKNENNEKEEKEAMAAVM